MEAHVSEMKATKSDIKCMHNTLASAHFSPRTSHLSSVDDTSGTYEWVIKDWSKILTPKHRSEAFTIGSFDW